MILYDKYVNYSVFDGEITLEKEVRNHFFSTVFLDNPDNRDIKLIVNGTCFNARLMNVPSSNSVQISYKNDLCEFFKSIFRYSFDYWETVRKIAKERNTSTRKLPPQTVESILISDTEEKFVFIVECKTHFDSENPYDSDCLESEESIGFAEGKKMYVKHITYERNQAIVNFAKKQFKTKHGALYCEVCGFSFDVYGQRGEGFIEVHHNIPVSQLGNEGVSKVEDMKMVCSNCHRILHLKRPWLKVHELKKLIEL